MFRKKRTSGRIVDRTRKEILGGRIIISNDMEAEITENNGEKVCMWQVVLGALESRSSKE